MYSSSNIHSSRGQHSQQQVAAFTAAGGSIHNSRSNMHSSRGNTHPQKQHCSAKAATEFHSSTMTSNTQQHVCSAC